MFIILFNLVNVLTIIAIYAEIYYHLITEIILSRNIFYVEFALFLKLKFLDNSN